ncbi:MAG: molybdopterin molybdotransferase MoeA [Rhizobiaceae bacterium]
MTARPSLIDDCFLHDKDRLQHEEALDLLQNRLESVVSLETIRFTDAHNRILGKDVVATHMVPLHTNSAVDGYAFDSADLPNQPLPVSGTIAAGDLDPPPLMKGTAVRIFTGAPMPAGAQTVAMQEDCTATDDTVSLPVELKNGANCRLAGEDLQPGDRVAKCGRWLAAADLAALASIGCQEVAVFKKLRIALFSNGNEMRIPSADSKPLRTGEVYDTNIPMLSALCSTLPVEITPMGIIRDDAILAEQAIKQASSSHDVILTTGGASRGAEDHMVTTLEKLGKRHLWQLAIKPGRPMVFGQIPRSTEDHDCLFFGLPGNPVAAMVCFLLYTRPALLKLAGGLWSTPHRFQVPSGFEIKRKKPDRREFLRGILQTAPDGTLIVDKFGRDGSGLISSLREADGLIEIPEHVTSLQKGALVSFIPFNSFT